MSRMPKLLLMFGLFLFLLAGGLSAQAAQPAAAKKVSMDRYEKYNQCMALCSNLKFNCEMSVPGPRQAEGQTAPDFKDYEARKHAKCDAKVEGCSAPSATSCSTRRLWGVSKDENAGCASIE